MSRDRDPYIEVRYDLVVATTDKALLVWFNNGVEEWIPRSQVEQGDRYESRDGPGVMSIAKWLANDKELEPIED